MEVCECVICEKQILNKKMCRSCERQVRQARIELKEKEYVYAT